jgi:uncharacterized protein YndB with AHSA1/START domain
MTAQTTTATKISFGSFTIERKFAHKPERVFRAFEDPEAQYRWFVAGEGWEIDNYTHDFRVGGHEHGQYRPEGAPITVGNDTRFLEIIRAQRIVSAYTMSIDGKPISHSLATIELFPDGANGCRLVYNEQGAYFGGQGDQEIANRKAGCEELFGKLGVELDTHS